MLKNAKIRKKIESSMAAISVIWMLMIAMAVFGIYRAHQRLSQVININIAAKEIVADMRETFQLERVILREAVITEAGNTAELEARIEEYSAKMFELLGRYESHEFGAENSETLKEIRRIYEQEFNNTKISILNDVKAGDIEAARLNLASRGSINRDLSANFNKLKDYDDLQKTIMIQDGEDGKKLVWILGSGMFVLSVIVGYSIIIYLTRTVAGRVEKLATAAAKIAAGSVDIEVHDDDKDEIGELCDAFTEMAAGIKLQVIAMQAVAEGDFSGKSKLRSEEDVLGTAINKTVENLNHVLATVHTAAEQVSTGSVQVSQASQSLASGSTEQAAALQELSASVTEVAKQSSENAENTGRATGYIRETEVVIKQGSEKMQILHSAMQEIGEASDKINAITKIIEDIAYQTNILALNAAVEAARAGSAGKGFAVVADEVRNLAAKSAEAAKQTEELIETTVKGINRGTMLTLETGKILESVESHAATLGEIISKIDRASSEQAGSIENITEGLSQISVVVQTNAATAEESSAASEELSAQAGLLNEEIGRFKLSGSVSGRAPIYTDYEPIAYKSTEESAISYKYGL